MRYVMRQRRTRVRRRDVWMKVKDPDQIKRWRVRRKLLQTELAFLVSCTQQTISLIETGKMSSLSEDLALAIAKKLDVPWEDLFTAHDVSVMPALTNDAHSERRLVSA
jgi:DNA-binding XRE family transcriptional regulator